MLTGAGGAPLLSEFVSFLAVRFGPPGACASRTKIGRWWRLRRPTRLAAGHRAMARRRHGATEEQANVAGRGGRRLCSLNPRRSDGPCGRRRRRAGGGGQDTPTRGDHLYAKVTHRAPTPKNPAHLKYPIEAHEIFLGRQNLLIRWPRLPDPALVYSPFPSLSPISVEACLHRPHGRRAASPLSSFPPHAHPCRRVA